MLGAPACISLVFCSTSGRFGRFHLPLQRHRRFGEGVFTDRRRGPQELFSRKMTFFLQPRIPAQNLGVRAIMATIGQVRAQEDFPATQLPGSSAPGFLPTCGATPAYRAQDSHGPDVTRRFRGGSPGGGGDGFPCMTYGNGQRFLSVCGPRCRIRESFWGIGHSQTRDPSN